MSNSRTDNTIKNAFTTLAAQAVTALLQFASRKVFIVVLGNAYLSLDGVFSNILTMLSLAELGFGEAIVFCLYKPLAIQDEAQTKALMNLYRRIYTIIAGVIFVLGIAVIPAFPWLLKDKPDIPENLYAIYLLFLLNTVISYLWIHKQSILIADQKNYVVYKVKMVASAIMMCIQIVLLILTHNYFLYLVVTILTTLVTNLFVSNVANKRYPYIKKYQKIPIDQETKRTIIVNVRALIIYKVGTMLVTGVDNILISSMIGVLYVGLYSNYTLIINKASIILRSIISSATGSVGNLNVLADNESKEKIGRKLLFITFWLFGYASSGLFNVVNDFMYFYAGKEYILSGWTVIFLVLGFYLLGVLTPMSIFRNTMGLYRYGKFRPMICAIVNLVISLALIKPFGIVGIVAGTFAARFCVTSWYEPRLVYKFGFNLSCKNYLIKYYLYMVVMIGASALSFFACLPLTGYTPLHFVLKVLIVTVITNMTFFIIFRRTEEFSEMRSLAVHMLTKFKPKRKGV